MYFQWDFLPTSFLKILDWLNNSKKIPLLRWWHFYLKLARLVNFHAKSRLNYFSKVSSILFWQNRIIFFLISQFIKNRVKWELVHPRTWCICLHLGTYLNLYMNIRSPFSQLEIATTTTFVCIISIGSAHSLIREVLIQSCSAGAKNFTNYAFCHVQFNSPGQSSKNHCAIKVKFWKIDYFDNNRHRQTGSKWHNDFQYFG